ncbi:MAG: hypothetical protein JRF05_07110 [Deltaproteobacteria bacterium]|nr:hypothetical protein [Deltaproteobacteria bacterium]
MGKNEVPNDYPPLGNALCVCREQSNLSEHFLERGQIVGNIVRCIGEVLR